MKSAGASTEGFRPEQLVLLSADRDDAVTRALSAGRGSLPWPLLEISADALWRDVEFGAPGPRGERGWRVGDRWLDPARVALVNRLPMADRLPGEPPAGADIDAGPGRQGLWTRLRAELGGFAYASSLPTATSLVGCFGSLADLWTDLPRWDRDVRVPAHATPPARLDGPDVHVVNRWALYQLGRPRDESVGGTEVPDGLRLEYRRPTGRLAVLAQVGGTLLFANPPPEMSRTQADAIVAFARRLAAHSPRRILEHVFFLAGDAPVLYSSCPVPVLSGAHPSYPRLVIQGLCDDIPKRGRVAGRG